MKYISTRGGIEPVSFEDAVMMGQSRDGGLLLPESVPSLASRLDSLRALSYPELAVEVLHGYTDMPRAALQDLITRSYTTFDNSEITPLKRLDNMFVLELFHGPTLAFKDLALQFLGRLFESILASRGGELNILTATSGDTGSAAISAARGRDGMRIFVLHPHGRISRSQELQMTSVLDSNVHNLAIEGTFDDCQGMLKGIFNDLAFKDRHQLGSANSINWARVLAQVVYYFYAALRVQRETGAAGVRVTVPTGNFGNIFAGFLAVRMGAPIRKLVLATNENDILSRFFNTGVYQRGDVHATISPSMDIQVASNFERYLYYLVGEDPKRVTELMAGFAETGNMSIGHPGGDDKFVAGAGNSERTLSTIRETYAQQAYLLDPHTAVGVDVAAQHLSAEEPMICLATAHPAKFGEAIREAVGVDVAHHPDLDALEGRETRVDVLPADGDAVKKYIAEKIGE
jgi:threonine synthase